MRVFIHGSCVSRDLLTLLQDDGFELSFYSPRQSLIGLLGSIPELVGHVDASKLTSRFQRRALEGMLTADLIAQLDKHASSTDMVLWDLTDERLGVYEIDGHYVTRTVELISVGMDTELQREARHIAFGSDEHFDLWSRGLDRWRTALESVGLADRVVLLAPRWAEHFTDGAATPSSYGVSAPEHEVLADRYYSAAQTVMPHLRIVARGLETAAGQDHQWGGAPFHFDDATSARMAAEVVAVTHESANAFPPPFAVVQALGSCRVVIRSLRSWGEKIAVHTLDAHSTIERSPYTTATEIAVSVPRPGRYRFRVFHMSGDHRAGVTTPFVDVP